MHGKFTIPGNPVGKPRMTQQDKWARRPEVLRYRAWATMAKLIMVQSIGHLPEGFVPGIVNWYAFFEIPKSWSPKRKAAAAGAPHRSKPDRDNIDKALLDALWDSDACVSSGFIAKRWDDGHGPRLEVSVVFLRAS